LFNVFSVCDDHQNASLLTGLFLQSAINQSAVKGDKY